MTSRVHAELRLSPFRHGVARVLILTVGPTGAHVHRRYVSAETLPTAEVREAFLRSIAVRKSLVPGEHEWVDAFPPVPPTTPVHVEEKPPHSAPLVAWEEAGFDPEAHFTAMEESILREHEASIQRKVFKSANRGGGLHSVLHLIDRDGPECCWCGKVTYPNLHDRHPLRATVEHVVPASQGGVRGFRNFRVACFSCNSVRGNKPEHPLYALRERPVPSLYPDPPRVLTPDEVTSCIWVEDALRALVTNKGKWLHLFFEPKGAGVRYRWGISMDESVSYAFLPEALLALGCVPPFGAATVEGLARAVEGHALNGNDYTVISFGPTSPTVSVSKDSWDRDAYGATLAEAFTQAFQDMLIGGPDWTEGCHS